MIKIIFYLEIFLNLYYLRNYICHMCHLGRVRDSEPRLQINSMSGKDTASSRLLVPPLPTSQLPRRDEGNFGITTFDERKKKSN